MLILFHLMARAMNVPGNACCCSIEYGEGAMVWSMHASILFPVLPEPPVQLYAAWTKLCIG